MSACGQCGFALEQGAAHCGRCGAPVADAPSPPLEAAAAEAPAAEKPKWGTLIRAPRAATGPIAMPERAASGDALPQPKMPAARSSSSPMGVGVPGSLAAEASAQAARARASSTSVQRQAPVRAPSGPIGQPRHPAARAASAPIAQPRHPAMRAPSGPITGAVVLPGAKPRAASSPLGAMPTPGVKPRAPSGALAAMPPMAAGEPANNNHLDTGLLELDDKFSSPMVDGPALEVASLNPGPRREPTPGPREQSRREPARRESPRPPHAAPQDPASALEQRAKRARDLARYPAAPPKLIGAIPYFLRVYARRRELEAQVVSLAQQRKRLEAGSDDALCLLGQALYVKRVDPQLKPLAAQMRVVGETAHDIGTRTAAAKKTESGLQQELASLERELSDARAEAEPTAAQAATLTQTVELHRQQLKRREMLIRKGEAEATALTATDDPASLVRVSALTAEREQHTAEIASLQQKLPPLEAELDAVRMTLEKQNALVASLEERKGRLHAQMGREQGRERVSVGGSQSAYRDALRSLATAAMKLDVAGVCPAELKEAIETQQLAAASRESEEIMRAAIAGYDAKAYQRGMQLLVGSTLGMFVLFLALIVF